MVVLGHVEVGDGGDEVAAVLHGLQDEQQVVVHIAEEGALRLAEEVVVGMEQFAEVFLQGEHAFLQGPVVLAELLYAFHSRHLGVAGHNQRLFHVLQFVFHPGDDGHVVRNHFVEDDAEQVSRWLVPYLQRVVVECRDDVAEHVRLFLGKRHEVRFSLHDGKVHRLVLIGRVFCQPFQDDDIVCLVLLYFGQVVGVQNVLSRQEVDAEQAEYLFDDARVLQPGHLHPVHAVALRERSQLRQANAGVAAYRFLAVGIQVYPGGGMVLARVLQLLGQEVVSCHGSSAFMRFAKDTENQTGNCHSAGFIFATETKDAVTRWFFI